MEHQGALEKELHLSSAASRGFWWLSVLFFVGGMRVGRGNSCLPSGWLFMGSNCLRSPPRQLWMLCPHRSPPLGGHRS